MTPRATWPPIHVGQIWERKAGKRHVRVVSHDRRWGVVRLEPLAHGRPSHAMEITLRRNYELVQDVER